MGFMSGFVVGFHEGFHDGVCCEFMVGLVGFHDRVAVEIIVGFAMTYYGFHVWVCCG